jgi:hypothetical protein
MNEIFNFKRFMNFARVRFAANRVFFFVPLFIPGLAVLLILSDLVFERMNGISEGTFQIFIGVMAFFIFMIIYASRAFSEFHRRDRSFMIATLPASVFEKYLYSVLLVTFGYAILYAISFFVSLSMITIYNNAIGAITSAHQFNQPASFAILSGDHLSNAIPGNPVNVYSYLKFIFALATLYAAGSIFFRRFGFLFTSLIFIVYVWFTTNLITLIFGHLTDVNFSSVITVFFMPCVKELNAFNRIDLLSIVSEISLFVVILFLWIAMFFRLKEKEY